MEPFLVRALQLILSLSILVVLHEFGHFAFARLFKVRVEKFYMFFNPNFSLIRAKKINGKWDCKFFSKNIPANERPKLDSDGDAMHDSKGKPIMEQIPESELTEGDWRKYPDNTEWGIGWIPLGGYCKISGMVDETTDVNQLNNEPQPWEYRSRSVWQRLPIIIGGVLVNFLLAMVIYSAVFYTWGQEYLPLKNAKYGLSFSQTMLDNGFKNGDNIVKIDGQPVERRADIVEQLLIDGKQSIQVSRDGKLIDLQLPSDFSQKVLAAQEVEFVSIRFPFVIDEVSDRSTFAKGKMQAGDSIVGINGKQLYIFQDVVAELQASRNTTVKIDFVRKGQVMTTEVQLDDLSKLGVVPCLYSKFMQTTRIHYGVFESVPAGIKLGWETLTSYIKQFKLVFTKEGSKNLGGFGAIGKMFPKTWDWQIFWSMTAFLSVILAFMNFLPIPALDGGYVLFLLYEMLTGKKPSDKFLEYAQTFGMLLLLALLLYANGNDIFKAIFR